jgi:uncharacterized damage-inducible protein DinB
MDAAYFHQLSRYNAWANERIYAACAKLSDEERKRRRPSFFGSIHRTLNHILVGDRVWLSRLDGRPHGIQSLDQELYGDFAELKAARSQEDARLSAILGSYKDEDLQHTLAYRSMAGEAKSLPMVQVLGHLFNHQTHHRGQVHGLISDTPVAPPSLDLLHLEWDEAK